MAKAEKLQFIAMLLAIAPYLADRYQLPVLLYKNHPSRLQSISAFKEYNIKFKDVVRNCEDVVIDEAQGVAFISCDPGRDHWNTVLVSVYVSCMTILKYANDLFREYSSMLITLLGQLWLTSMPRIRTKFSP
jgi:hypothetical protein